MKNDNVYQRKISSEEAREGYIFVLKDRLSFFPSFRKEFILQGMDQNQNVKVESYPCQCQGPDYPHEHYFVRWPGVKRGESIVITKKDNNYTIQIHH